MTTNDQSLMTNSSKSKGPTAIASRIEYLTVRESEIIQADSVIASRRRVTEPTKQSVAKNSIQNQTSYQVSTIRLSENPTIIQFNNRVPSRDLQSLWDSVGKQKNPQCPGWYFNLEFLGVRNRSHKKSC